MISIIISFLFILLIDLSLSVDNASVNAAIVRGFPKPMRNKVLMIGMAISIMLRISLVFFVSFLYQLPFLKFAGGIWVVLMGIKMSISDEREKHTPPTVSGFVMAGLMLGWTDLTMSVDNVLALMGAAGGRMYLVDIGILLTIPFLFIATKFIVNIISRFPLVNTLLAGVLGYVGFKMMFSDLGSVELAIRWVSNYPEYFSGIAGFSAVVGIGVFTNVRLSRMRNEIAATKEKENDI